MSGQVTGNQNGTILENQIGSLLDSKGYARVHIMPEITTQYPWYISQHRKYRTIYDTQMRLDYYLFHPSKWPDNLAVECKWQSSPGTVDEKIPYTVLNMKALPVPSALFMAGGGYRRQAVEYAKSKKTENFVVVEGLDAILKWAQVYL